MNKIRTLVVLVNYGEEQLEYLGQVIGAFNNFKKYDVTVIVNSNIDIKMNGIDKVNVINLSDYQLLPLSCRETIWNKKDQYDLFIYGENDHLFLEKHLDKHLEYSKILPKNRLPGLIQYEKGSTGVFYPGYHDDFDWDYNSVEIHSNKVFAHFGNLHQASFILTKNQLERISKKINFIELVNEHTLHNKIVRKLKNILGVKVERLNKYSIKCKVNTDLFKYGGMKKVICISEFEDNLIHHLPNLYIKGEKGRKKQRSSQDRMENALKRLLTK